jgi:hypothetical protein
MLRIDSKDAAKGIVRLAPWGTEEEPIPCLVWVDPDPDGLTGRFCKVQDESGNLISAPNVRGLRALAKRFNLKLSEEFYVP